MKVIKFDLERYEGELVVMHCPEEWQAELFCKFLHNAGRMWKDGDAYLSTTMWNDYKESTIYYFNEGLYGSISDVTALDYTKLNISDYIFDTDAMNQPPITGNKEDYNMITLKEFREKNPAAYVFFNELLKDELAEFIDNSLKIADDYGLDKNEILELQSDRFRMVIAVSDFTIYKPRGTEDED